MFIIEIAIRTLLLMGILSLPLIAYAKDIYVRPGGSGTKCTTANPCTLKEGVKQAVGGDTVWLKDGTYTQSFKTVRGGISNTNRITFKAVNRHAAIVRFGPATHSHFHIDDSWITVSGLNIFATSKSGGHAHDAIKVSDGKDRHPPIKGVIFEDNYVHDSGHLLVWSGNTVSPGVEVRNNTFENSGFDDSQGEANYLGSCCGKQNPGVFNSHHNVYSKFQANGVDFKGEMRDGHIHNNFFMDHKEYQCKCGNANCKGANGRCLNHNTGDGFFVVGVDSGDRSSSSTNNRVIDNAIWRPRSKTIFAFVDPVQIRASGNVVMDWVASSGTSNPSLNASKNMEKYSVTHSNMHCPSEGMGQGTQNHGSNPPNHVNQAQDKCDERVREIVGVPKIVACNIGNIDNKTIIVDIETERNGPISSIDSLDVMYNGVDQRNEVTTLEGNNQARIAVTDPPANKDVVVRVVAVEGDIKNSAFIGGMTCGNRDHYGDANYIRGQGFCGENDSKTLICSNTISGK